MEKELHLPKRPLWVNVGCGSIAFAGMVNTDLYKEVDGKVLPVDICCDARHLPFEDNTVDHLYSSHVYEHFDILEQKELLKEWYRVIKPDGWVDIECPALDRLCEKYLSLPEWQRSTLWIQMMGRHDIPGHGHKKVPSTLELTSDLWEAGFVEIIEIPAMRYADLSDSCVRMLGRKGAVKCQ